MITLWNTLIFEPLYNLLVFLISAFPGGSVAIATILLTVFVKLLMAPLSQKSIKSQAALKEIEPKLNAIKERYKDNKQMQAQETFALYKKHGVNPFSGCLLLLIQFPIIIALYLVFLRGIDFNTDLLYNFVSYPEVINTHFLGFIDLAEKSIILALLAGLSQFIQARFSQTMNMATPEGVDKDSFKGQLQKSMKMQMKYVLPIFITFIAYSVSAGVALYWATSNTFTIVQEYFIRRKKKKENLAVEEKVIDIEIEDAS